MSTTSDTPHATREIVSACPQKLLIGGDWREAAGAKTMTVEDPATSDVIATVADGSLDDGWKALDCAVGAQAHWAFTSPRHRSEILRAAYELIVGRIDDLARLITAEMGKPLREARGEVSYAAEFFRWFSEEAVRIEGGFTTSPDGAKRALVTAAPVGPCLLVTPWNFPLAMGARKIAPAIAAGCTMVVKPAPQTPLSTLALAAILREAGLPDGVLNVITTSHAGGLVQPLLQSGRIRKLSFTGSTAVGRILLEQCSTAVLRTSMELGGNAAFVVCADADLDVAVDAAMQAKMRNGGQACTAANRFFIHSSVAEEFSSQFAAAMAALQTGPGWLAGSEVGPLIDDASRRKVDELVREATDRGAAVVTGGSASDGPGYFYPPTVLTGVDDSCAISRTEIFGPVAALQTFDDHNDVITRANNTDWGLVGYVFSQDIDRALDISERLAVGMVGLNCGIVSDPAAPFGGVKQSGLGREGGRVGIDEYLDYKLITTPIRRAPELAVPQAQGTH